jgi:diguanylate cyclase (GGDEF)-like protein
VVVTSIRNEPVPVGACDDVATRQSLEGTFLEIEFRAATTTARPDDLVKAIQERAEASGWPDLAARAAVFTAESAVRQGKLVEAARALRGLLDWAQAHDESGVLSDARRVMASVFRAIGDHPEALSMAIHSLAALPDSAPWWRRARNLNLLGVALDLTGSWPEAMAAYAEVLALATPSPRLTLLAVNNLAYGHCLRGEDDAAEEYGRRMLDLSRNGGVILNAGDRDTLARIAMRRGDYAAAEQYLAPATAGRQEPGTFLSEPDGFAMCLLVLAEVRRCTGDYSGATAALDRCREEATELDLRWVGAEIHLQRAELAAAQEHYREALAEHRRYHDAWVRLQDEQREVRAQVIRTLYMNEEAIQARDQFRELATHDPLTGLHNRRYCDEALNTLTAQAQARPGRLSAALLDFDHFKRINDTCSHQAGDLVLKGVATILRDACPPPAVVARLGGEEFVLVLPDSDPDAAFALCERVRVAVQEHDWSPITGQLPVTVSIGLSTARQSTTSAKLLADADRNLYAAKRMGRNRVVADPGTVS